MFKAQRQKSWIDKVPDEDYFAAVVDFRTGGQTSFSVLYEKEKEENLFSVNEDLKKVSPSLFETSSLLEKAPAEILDIMKKNLRM